MSNIVKCNKCGYTGPMRSRAISQEQCPKCYAQGSLNWTNEKPVARESYMDTRETLVNLR